MKTLREIKVEIEIIKVDVKKAKDAMKGVNNEFEFNVWKEERDKLLGKIESLKWVIS